MRFHFDVHSDSKEVFFIWKKAFLPGIIIIGFYLFGCSQEEFLRNFKSGMQRLSVVPSPSTFLDKKNINTPISLKAVLLRLPKRLSKGYQRLLRLSRLGTMTNYSMQWNKTDAIVENFSIVLVVDIL